MAEGDVGAVVDSYKFEATDIEEPCLVHVDGNIFAVAYMDAAYNGWIKTFNIAEDGTITDPFIDSYEFDAVSGRSPHIINVDGNVFAVVFTGESSDGWLKTVNIADDGTITDPFIDSYEFDAGLGTRPHIIHVSGNVFAIVWTDIWDDGMVATVEIATNGTITKAKIDSLEFAPTDGKYCKIVNVTGSIFAIAYIDSGNDCWIATVAINPGGSIGDTVVDNFLFSAGTFSETSLIKISANVFAIIYQDVNNDGWITTVEIADSGTITKSIVDSYEFDAVYGTFPYIIHISGNVFAIAYNGEAAGGMIKTIEIDAAGQITEPFLSSGNYDATAGTQPSFLFVAGSVYVVAYRGFLADGFISTVSIETLAAGGPHHEVCMGMGP